MHRTDRLPHFGQGSSLSPCNPLVPDSSSASDANRLAGHLLAPLLCAGQHVPLLLGLIEIQPNQQTQVPGVCDKAEGKVRPISEAFIMGSQAFQDFLLRQPRALRFEPSLSVEEVDLKPPLEEPCDSANFLFPTRCAFARDNFTRCPPVKMELRLCSSHGTTSVLLLIK